MFFLCGKSEGCKRGVVISGSWCVLNDQENLFWFLEIKPVHLSHIYHKPDALQQKSLKSGESSSVRCNVKPFCHCQSWISSINPFNGVTNHCDSFHKKQPKWSHLINKQSSTSVLNTNKTTSTKFASKDLESNFDSVIQSTKQSTTFVGFPGLICNWTASCKILFAKIKIEVPRNKLVTTWILQKWESLVQKLRK